MTAEYNAIKRNVVDILEFFEEQGIRATFFCLGIIAEQQPEIIRMIANAGHEIASHCYEHLRLYNQDKRKAKEDIARSKMVLEDVSGQAVLGFRAPEFSISSSTMYLVEFIGEAGYAYDSSLNPASYHDVYGIKGARRHIHVLENGLIEFPPSSVKMAGMVFPALGGGYFRLYPLFLSSLILKSLETGGESAMIYIHPHELGSVRPRIEGMTRLRRFRHYVNIGKCRQRCAKLVGQYHFGAAVDILKARGLISVNVSR